MKGIVRFVSAFMIIALLTAQLSCSKTSGGGKENIDFSSKQLEIDPMANRTAALVMTDYKGSLDSGKVYYEYNGGEMELGLEIHNGAAPWEYGLGIMLDGVCQRTVLVTEEGETEESWLHRVELAPETAQAYKLRFTPTVGKAGEVLSVGVLTVGVPSFLPAYKENATYLYHHMSSASFDAPLVMNADAPNPVSALEVDVERFDVPQAYLDELENYLRRFEDPSMIELERNEYSKITLYSDPPGTSAGLFDRDPYLLAPNGDGLTAYFEAFGKPQSYRLTVFIDHEPVELAPGKTYFDISADRDSVARVKLDIPLNGRTEYGCIYAMIAEHPDWENEDAGYTDLRDFMSNDTYVCNYSTPTKFLFIGSVPEPVTPEPTTDAPSGETPPPVEKGAQLGIRKNGLSSVPMLLTDDGKLVLIDSSISFFETKTPVTVYDIAENKVISTFELPENILLTHLAGGELIAVQNPVYDHAAVSIFDLSGKLLRSFELTGELGIGAEEREAIKNEYPGARFDRLNAFTMLSEDGASLLHAERTMGEDGAIKVGETYLYDLKTGEKKSVALELDEFFGIPCYFDGERIAAPYNDPQNGATVVEFYSLDGSKLKELSIKASGDVYKSVCSTAGKSLLLCDNASREDKLTGKLVLIDTEAFEISEFEAKARDSKWAKLSMDGRLILTLGGDENRAVLRLYERESGRVLREFSLENVINPWFESIACVDTANSRILVQNAVAGEDGEQEYVVTSIHY